MNPTKVSIIVPVYNAGKLLNKCLDSLKNQTLTDIEIICVDDGSTDNSLETLEKYSAEDNRFKVISQKNSGAGSARNTALDNVCGEFMLFVDADDWICNDACEILYNRAKSLNCDLILFNAVRHMEDNQTMDLIHFTDSDIPDVFDYNLAKDKVLNAYFGVIWSKFYKKSLISDNNIRFPKHKLYNDVEFHIKTMLLADKISYVHKILYHYNRIGQNSLQTSYVTSRHGIVFYDVMCGVYDFLKDNNFLLEFKKEFINFTFKEFERKLEEIDDEYKAEYFKKIKIFFSSLNLSVFELNEISFPYLVYYNHVINSSDYGEFNLMQENFKGNIALNDFDEVLENENAYLMVLENKFAHLIDSFDEMQYYLNIYKQKELANKKTITNTSPDELMRLKDAEKYLINKNNKLMAQNQELKNRNLWWYIKKLFGVVR